LSSARGKTVDSKRFVPYLNVVESFCFLFPRCF
jgi:hypothetical protein